MARRRRWGAGTVTPPTTPGGSWAIRYQTPHGRAYESGFPSEILARQALEARRVDQARERIGLPVDAARLPTIAVLGDAWITRRLLTHRGAPHERMIWRAHLRPELGSLRIPDLDVARVRRYVETKRAGGLSGATVRGHVAAISALYEDCRERPRETGATGPNPCHDLPTSIAVQLRPATDPRTVPYVEREYLTRIYDALPEPIRTGYAVGVLAGLRTGEVRALRWEHVDLERRQIVVREAVGISGHVGPVKDSEARVLPIDPDLLAVLRARRLATGGRGLIVPPAHPGRRSGPQRAPARSIRSQTLNEALARALEPLGLAGKGLDWYRATRHSYASLYVLGGGSLHQLSVLLGHASAQVTLRYAHLQPHRLAEADTDRIRAGLSAPRGAEPRAIHPGKSPASARSLPDKRRARTGSETRTRTAGRAQR